jgi:RND superfamily putative drug exporter
MARLVRRPARRRRTPLEWIGQLVSRRPRTIVVVWFVVLGILAAQGLGLASKVSSAPVFVDGSETEREHTVSLQEFGSDSALVVMLRGPHAAVEREGPALVNRLEAIPSTLVNSPWGAHQTLGGLRPNPRTAALVVSAGKPTGPPSDDAVRQIESEIHRTVSKDVHTSIAGGLAFGDALRTAADNASKVGEALAIPVLLIVLLFVCRSLIAAAMPVVVGAMVVAATKGVLDLSAGMVRVDSFALGAAGMLGLALGVDYSLLVVSRFREERETEAGADIAGAVQATVMATGRSIVPAGCGLVLAMLISAQVLPSAVISSVSLAVIVASVLSVLSAIFATPAILVMVGKHLDRWSLPKRKSRHGMLPRWTQRISSRPGMVLAVGFVLFVCAAWAFTLKTNIGAVVELPPNNPSRIQHEEVEHTLGPGWIAPFEVIMQSAEGPVTTPQRLRALTTFQNRVEADPGIATMAGFDSLAGTTKQFEKFKPGLDAQQKGLVRIGGGVSKVKAGSTATSKGFSSAAEGAQQLDSAIGQTSNGSGRLAKGLRSTAQGSEKLNGGLERAGSGSGKLAKGTVKSSNGASKLAKALKEAEEKAGEATSGSRILRNTLDTGEESLASLPEAVGGSEERLLAAQQALQRMTAGRSDPQYAAAVAAVEEASRGLMGEAASKGGTVQAGIERAQGQFSLGLYLAARQSKKGHESEEGIGKLAKAASRLNHGLNRLASSSQDLSGGIAKLSEGGNKLSPGLRKLTDSAERLAGGLGEIGSGAEELAGGLGKGAVKSTQLTGALGRIDSGVQRLQGPEGKGQFHQLDVQSPGLFKTGYFMLAGLAGSEAERREQVGFLINLGNGGNAARMLIVPRYDPNTTAATETQRRLHGFADELEKEAGAEVLVGGVTPSVSDLNSDLRDQAPLARLALSIVTILILLFVTRSLVIPLIAAALNLLTVSATFGLLSLLFNGSLLGGPGYIDTVIIPASIILIFGLAIDYEVFIFARMREEYVRTGSAETAVTDGLSRSANVVTGAALIMICVFLAFATSPLTTLRSFGVALAVAVFIDAFLVRFVIVPAIMRALGERSWWMPRWLDRLLPGGAFSAVTVEEE